MPRRATLDDARGIAVVHVESWRSAYRGLLPDAVLEGLSVDRREAQWREWLVPGSTTEVHVITVDGRVVSFVASGPSREKDAQGPAGEVYAVYALAERWGQGDGAVLLATAEGRARLRGEAQMTLWVLESNRRARAFYERHGWAPDGQRALFKTADGSEHPELRYVRPFG